MPPLRCFLLSIRYEIFIFFFSSRHAAFPDISYEPRRKMAPPGHMLRRLHESPLICRQVSATPRVDAAAPLLLLFFAFDIHAAMPLSR